MRTGVEQTDVDALTEEFAAQGLAHGFERELGHGVGTKGRTGQHASNRGDNDHATVAALDHLGQRGLGHAQGAKDVDIKDLANNRLGYVGQWSGLTEAGVVNQDVHVPVGDLVDVVGGDVDLFDLQLGRLGGECVSLGLGFGGGDHVVAAGRESQ